MNRRLKKIVFLLAIIQLFNNFSIAFGFEDREKLQEKNSITTDLNVGGTINSKMTQVYTVTVPETIAFGELSSQRSCKQNYNINVDINENCGDLIIVADDKVSLKQGDSHSLVATNSLKETSVMKTAEIKKTLEISQEEVKSVKPGDYKGILNFSFIYKADEVINIDKAEIPKLDNEESLIIKEATVTKGLNKLTENLPSDSKVSVIIDRIVAPDFKNSDGYKNYFPNDYIENTSKHNSEDVKRIEQYIKELNLMTIENLDYLTINLILNSNKGKEILTDIDNVLEIRLPYDMNKIGDDFEVALFRNHKGEVRKLTKLEKRPRVDTEYFDGQYYVGEDCIYIYSSKYSLFSICKVKSTKVGIADYVNVDKALSRVPKSLNDYTDESAKRVLDVKMNILYDLPISRQSEVDKMAYDLNKAIDALEFKAADYSRIDKAMKLVPSDLSIYTDESRLRVESAISVIKRGLDIRSQNKVDKWAISLEVSIKELVKKTVSNEKPTVPIDKDKFVDGKYTAITSFRKDDNFKEISMCNSLFSRGADITVKGDNAILTLYVVNPVPAFPDSGVPLSNVKLMYDEKEYKATVDTSNSQKKHFNKDDRFILKGDNYKTAKIIVTLPKNALLMSSQGQLKCEVFVNAIMKSTEKFYLVLSDFVNENGDKLDIVPPIVSNPDDSNNSNIGSNGTGNNDSVLPEANGNYENLTEKMYTGTLSCRKSTSFKDKSMCDPLFYKKVDVEIKEDNAILTMYVIDPIPSYPNDGTPLSNISFTYNGKSYKAKTVKDDSAIRYFDMASGFIEKAGDYKTTKVIVTLPKSAISQSVNGRLMCKAFINTVMKVNQQFYVVITDLKAGSTKQTSETTTEIDEMSENDDNNSLSNKDYEKTEDDNDTSKGLLRILGYSKTITIIFIITVVILIVSIIVFVYWRYGGKNGKSV